MQKEEIRFGDYLKEMTVNHVHISYNNLTQEAKSGAKIKLRVLDIYRLLAPYLSIRFTEQLRAVIPLSFYLVFFQLFFLRQTIQDSVTIALGLLAVMIGLMMFMEGIKLGLMPFGETLGNTLPKKVKLVTVLLIAFLLGVGVTFAEPAIGALKAAGSLVGPKEAPYLYALLNLYTEQLVGAIGAGVGLAAILGTLRFICGWSLKPLLYLTILPTLLVTLYFVNDPALTPVIGLAWDSGAVTTGPVTVPLVLALGIGIACAAGKGDSSLSGFGIVTLASILPILGVMLLALMVRLNVTPTEIIQLASTNATNTQPSLFEQSPMIEIILALRAIVPLVLFLFFIMLVILHERIKNAPILAYGLTLSVIGMAIFNIGLTYGLANLGNQSGSWVPLAFNNMTTADGVKLEALYPYPVGLMVALSFAFILGFGATLAEPALNALGLTVENLTNGVFHKKTLIYAVSLGVGIGLALGVVKIIFGLSLAWLLLPLYLLALILSYFSTEEFVNIGWDSAGVTTGPITVPLVLAMGLGFGNALGISDGFGILAMASICPILTVLIMGLYVQRQTQKG
ncbi:MAG: DUF1538 domain-containing protein [Campylobacterales bacterium]